MLWKESCIVKLQVEFGLVRDMPRLLNVPLYLMTPKPAVVACSLNIYPYKDPDPAVQALLEKLSCVRDLWGFMCISLPACFLPLWRGISVRFMHVCICMVTAIQSWSELGSPGSLLSWGEPCSPHVVTLGCSTYPGPSIRSQNNDHTSSLRCTNICPHVFVTGLGPLLRIM